MSPTNTSYRTWNFPKYTVLVAAALLAFGSSAQDRVKIKGKGLVASHVRTPLHLTLVVGDSMCVWVNVKRRGRFEIESKEDQQYLLRFEQSGSITKIVKVDTRFAERKLGSKKRTVEFDVVMEPLSADRQYRYVGPVGKIAFHRSNGRQEVERTYIRTPLAVEVVGEEW